MDKLFENHTPYTKENYIALNRFNFKRNHKRLLIGTGIAALVFLMIAIAEFVSGKTSMGIIFLIYLGLALLLSFVIYPLREKASIRRLEIAEDRMFQSVFVTAFYDEVIRMDVGDSHKRTTYGSVTKGYEVGDWFYLFLGSASVLMLHKDGFTCGEPESFRNFCLEKLGKKFRVIQ